MFWTNEYKCYFNPQIQNNLAVGTFPMLCSHFMIAINFELFDFESTIQRQQCDDCFNFRFFSVENKFLVSCLHEWSYRYRWCSWSKSTNKAITKEDAKNVKHWPENQIKNSYPFLTNLRNVIVDMWRLVKSLE